MLFFAIVWVIENKKGLTRNPLAVAIPAQLPLELNLYFYTFVHVPVKQSILYGLLFSTVLDGLLRLTFF